VVHEPPQSGQHEADAQYRGRIAPLVDAEDDREHRGREGGREAAVERGQHQQPDRDAADLGDGARQLRTKEQDARHGEQRG
jgi:hypothetical protein